MLGTVSSYLPSKGYGFVKGDDGNHYFLHQRDLLDGCQPQPGLRVGFDEAATPKGYRACRIRVATTSTLERYETPNALLATKHSEFRDWEVIEAVPWHLIGTSRDSPDAAREDLLGRAIAVGANAVMLMQYFKTQGSEAGAGRGTHSYTIHNYRAVPAVVGRLSSGGCRREQLKGLGRRLQQLAAEHKKANLVRDRWRAAVALLGVFVFAYGAWTWTIVGAIAGLAIITGSQWLNQRDGTWMQPH